jgi:hypothetical protein
VSDEYQLDVTPLILDARKIMTLLGVTEPADVLPELKRRLPQQPVQALDMYGCSWWWHPCGLATADRDHHEQVCRHPGPWRPLLVGGDPAPEQLIPATDVPKCCETVGVYNVHAADCPTPYASGAMGSATQPDLMAQVMAERDKARADRDQMQENAEAWKAQYDEARAEVERLKAAAALTPEDARRAYDAYRAAMAAPADPLILSLPTVPEGAVALVGAKTGRRYTPGPRPGEWYAGAVPLRLGTILMDEGSVRVEMAPPRESST